MSHPDNTKDLAMPAEKDAELLAMLKASLHALREEGEKQIAREAAIKDRIDHLERNSVNHTRTSRLVDMIIVGAAVMLVQLVASKVGIG